MPEEHESAPPSEDTPQVDTPVSQEDTAEETGVVDYRSRYENLLPEYTRKSQRLAELEREHQQYAPDDQYEDDDDEYEEIDSNEWRRLAREEAERVLSAHQRREAEKQAEINFVKAELTTLEREVGDTFTDAERELLGTTSERLRDESGRPDVRRAYEHFNEIFEGRKQKWVSGKRSTKPAAGPGAAEVVDLDDSEARAEFIDRVMAASHDDD